MFGRRGLSDLPVPNTSFRQFKFNLISMSQPTRKCVIPFSEDASLPQAPSLLTGILEQYERRSVAAKAISWGMLVTLVGLLLDDLTSRLDTTWLNQRLIENAIEGAFFTALVWIVLSARDRRLQRRLKNRISQPPYSQFPDRYRNGRRSRRRSKRASGNGEAGQFTDSTLYRKDLPGGGL